MVRTTISVIKADIGSVAGHVEVHEEVLDCCEEVLEEALEKGVIIDYYVTNCGDDTQLIMTHRKGVDNPEIHETAWRAFEKGTEKARELKLYGAGQDILSTAFSGTVKGLGPGLAEMEFEERGSDPIAIFACDKTAPSAFNLPIYRIFADPFNTVGLVIDPKLHKGFIFEVHDIIDQYKYMLSTPEELYDLLALIGDLSRFAIKRVTRKEDGEIAAVMSTEKLSLIAGKYVGKDDPVAIVRAQSGFPAMGEILEAFTVPHMVPGWMRGSHWGPLMPVSNYEATPTRFDGPPRVIGLGFQISNSELIGPVDLFDDPAFDPIRRKAAEIADYIRGHGSFEPHRLPSHDMEYTTLPKVLEKLDSRKEKL